MPEFWDFDEKINYKVVNLNNNNYKVLNIYKDYYDSALLLDKIRNFIDIISEYLHVNKYRYKLLEQKHIYCFLLIHPNNYLLSEMQLNTEFDGLNKPKKLYKSNTKLGPDNYLRASYRDVFLRLRKDNGEFKNINSIRNLVIHEIAHTMCNHVTWRDDNHHWDFEMCENILKEVVNDLIKIKHLNVK